MHKHNEYKASQFLVIGDNYVKDYKPAKRLGMQAFLIDTYQKNIPGRIKHGSLKDLYELLS